MNKYWENINALNDRQEKKGLTKYGEILEENKTLTTEQRIEHAEEEAIDLLKYLEHLKTVISGENLTVDDYQRAALRTVNPETVKEPFELVKNGVLGLSGETGEVADILKKYLYQNHDFDTTAFIEELGDIAWYLAICCEGLGVKMSTVFNANISKLKSRYPYGFDKARSISRNETNK